MLIVSDVHGAAEALARVVARDEPVLILGDLINFIDYRTNEGIVSDVAGKEFVAEMVALRTAERFEEARRKWGEFSAGREDELRAEFDRRTEQAYDEVCSALAGGAGYVTYGNVDRPAMLRDYLPDGFEFVDGAVVDIDGLRVGFAGGGIPALGIPGEVGEEEMEEKLRSLGAVDVLCTHVPPAVASLSVDVVGGRQKGSAAVLSYLLESRPKYHYFGDVHQPQATSWVVGSTRCINVGYFRATGRPVRHG